MGRDRVRNPLRMAADAAAWPIAAVFVWAVLTLVGVHFSGWMLLAYAAVAAATQLGSGAALAYRGRYRVSTFEELSALTAATAATACAVAAAALTTGWVTGKIGASAALAAFTPPLALVLILLGRGWWLHHRESQRPDPAETLSAVVYGAGEAGEQLLRLLRSHDAPYRVVALIDDDPQKRNLRLLGVPVRGSGNDLDDVVNDTEADAVILAMGRPDRDLVRSLVSRTAALGVALRVLPPVAEIVHGRVRISDVRDVEVSDILGRRPIATDVSAIAGHLTGRRVFVTGAGGSIGSELARQLHHFAPSSLVLLDRDESALHGVQLSIYGKGLLDTPDMVLADIRDKTALRRAFQTHRPEVVFHAAALKHLPMLEQYPDEAWQTNVLGTLNLLELALEFSVDRFITISTDKAADPTSVLGESKLLAERLTAWAAQQDPSRTFVSVRFGNVLGSRGSVLETFRHQIAAGGPVTVTDAEVTRYFMTIPEACELVLQAAVIGRPGEVLVLDMGKPVRILDVARLLVERSGADVPIIFTGLRPGEKLNENLFSDTESGERPFHPLISHVSAIPLAPDALDVAYTDGVTWSVQG